MNDAYTLDSSALHDLLLGATLFGGGGGGPRSGALPLIDYIERLGTPPRLLPLSALPDALTAGVVAGIGAPDAATHGPAFTTAPRRAFTELAQASGRTLDAVLPGETGAMNSIIPALVAAQLDLPLVDADSAGRALPTLGLAAYNLAAPPSPLILANEPGPRGDAVDAILRAPSPDDIDALVRGLVETPAFGQAGAFATWALTRRQLAGTCVPGSVSRAIRVGATLREVQARGLDPLTALRAVLPAVYLLASGVVAGVTEQEGGGFDMNRIELDAGGRRVVVVGQNENLIAWRDNDSRPIATAPDILAWLSPEGEPLSNAEITPSSVGRPLLLLGLPADPILREAPLADRFARLLGEIGYFGKAVRVGTAPWHDT